MKKFWQEPRPPYKPEPPAPVTPTKMESVSFHSDLVGRALYTESVVEQEIEEFMEEHDLDYDNEKVQEERKRLYNEKYKGEEFIELDDDADYDEHAVSTIKYFTIQDLINKCPKDVPLDKIAINLSLEDSESCESPMMHGISFSWEVNRTPEEIEELTKHYEHSYKECLKRYEKDFAQYEKDIEEYNKENLK